MKLACGEFVQNDFIANWSSVCWQIWQMAKYEAVNDLNLLVSKVLYVGSVERVERRISKMNKADPEGLNDYVNSL